MDRLTDLRRLQSIANVSSDTAEYAKLEAKIQKTLASLPKVETTSIDVDSISLTSKPKRLK